MPKKIIVMTQVVLLLFLAACNDGNVAETEIPEAELWVHEHPDSPYAWNNAAVYRLNARDWVGAVETFEKLTEFKPDEPFNYAYLAVANAHVGEKDKARRLMS